MRRNWWQSQWGGREEFFFFKRERERERGSMLMAAQLGDNYIPGHYKLKILLMRQIWVWWISCFPSTPPSRPPFLCSCCHHCCLFNFKSCLLSNNSPVFAAGSPESLICSSMKASACSGLSAAAAWWPWVTHQSGHCTLRARDPAGCCPAVAARWRVTSGAACPAVQFCWSDEQVLGPGCAMQTWQTYTVSAPSLCLWWSSLVLSRSLPTQLKMLS